MIDILCIGNPRLPGDSIGPRVGDLIKHSTDAVWNDINLIGTTEDPVVRSNIDDKVKLVRQGTTLVVVDSALGNDVGAIKVFTTGVTPGGALMQVSGGRVGDYTIVAITGTVMMDLLFLSEIRVKQLSDGIYKILLTSVKEMQK